MTTPDTNATSPAVAGSDPVLDPTFANDLTAFIQGEVVTEDEVVATDTDLLLTGLVDSLGVVMIVEWIENELGITIDPADVVLEHFQTIELMLEFCRTT